MREEEVKPSLDPMTLVREFREKKDKFIHDTGKYPTRVVIHWTKWSEMTDPYRHFTVKCDPPEDGKARYEDIEVIRTWDSPGLLEFLP